MVLIGAGASAIGGALGFFVAGALEDNDTYSGPASKLDWSADQVRSQLRREREREKASERKMKRERENKGRLSYERKLAIQRDVRLRVLV